MHLFNAFEVDQVDTAGFYSKINVCVIELARFGRNDGKQVRQCWDGQCIV